MTEYDKKGLKIYCPNIKKMPSKPQMIKNLRKAPGVSIFSPELQAKIEKCHSENDNCFLCKELSTENSILEKITKSSWTQIVPFMKKTGIPPCMIDLGRRLEDKVMETCFSYTMSGPRSERPS